MGGKVYWKESVEGMGSAGKRGCSGEYREWGVH